MRRARRDYRAFKPKKTGIGTGLTGRFPVDTGEIQVIYRDGFALSICIATSWRGAHSTRLQHLMVRSAHRSRVYPRSAPLMRRSAKADLRARLEPWAAGTALARGPALHPALPR